MFENTKMQRVYESDVARLKKIVVMLTKRWGHQATMADAIHYLLNQEEQRERVSEAGNAQ